MVSVISIFGKAADSHNCLNCGQHKSILINLNDELFSRSEKFWSLINETLLEEVVYDNQNKKFLKSPEQRDTIDFNNFLTFKQPEKMKIIYV